MMGLNLAEQPVNMRKHDVLNDPHKARMSRFSDSVNSSIPLLGLDPTVETRNAPAEYIIPGDLHHLVLAGEEYSTSLLRELENTCSITLSCKAIPAAYRTHRIRHSEEARRGICFFWNPPNAETPPPHG
jgi:hypothetical protein